MLDRARVLDEIQEFTRTTKEVIEARENTKTAMLNVIKGFASTLTLKQLDALVEIIHDRAKSILAIDSLAGIQ